MSVVYLYSSADTFDNGWTSNGESNNYSCIDDVYTDSTGDGATTNISASFDGKRFRCSLTTNPLTSENTITSVDIHYAIGVEDKREDRGSLLPYLYLSGSTTNGTTNICGDNQYIAYDDTGLARPGGGSWAYSDLDDLQIAGKSVINNKGEYVYITQFYVKVTYTLGGTELITEGYISVDHISDVETKSKSLIDYISNVEIESKLPFNYNVLYLPTKTKLNLEYTGDFYISTSLVPFDDTVTINWTPFTGVDNYALVNDGSDLTYVTKPSNNQLDLYDLDEDLIDTLGDLYISNVEFIIRALRGSVGTGYIDMYIQQGVDTASSEYIPITTGINNYSYNFSTAPDGGDWNVTKLKATKIGMQGTAQYTFIRVYECKLVVTFRYNIEKNLQTILDYGKTFPSISKNILLEYIPSYWHTSKIRIPYGWESAYKHPVPTSLECEYQTNPTDIYEWPVLTALYQATGNGTAAATACNIIISEKQDGGNVVWGSGWRDISSIEDNERSDIIRYNGGGLSSDPENEKYYWQIKYRDINGHESQISDTATFNVTERSWADHNYIFRRKLTFPDSHSTIPAGYTQDFTIKTGNRQIVAQNGMFNEAVQASYGAGQVLYYDGKTHIVYLAKIKAVGVTVEMRIYIQSFDHSTGLWGVPYDINRAYTTDDSHHYPVITVDDRGMLWIFYGCHSSGVLDLKWCVSNYVNMSGALPGEIEYAEAAEGDLWDVKVGLEQPANPPHTLTGEITYPYAFFVDSIQRLYVFIRGGIGNNDRRASYAYTDDYGNTWNYWNYFILYNPNTPELWYKIGKHGDVAYRVYTFGLKYNPDTERMHCAWVAQAQNDKWEQVSQSLIYIYSDLDTSDSGFHTWKYIDESHAGYSTSSSLHTAYAVNRDDSKALKTGDSMYSWSIVNMDYNENDEPLIFGYNEFTNNYPEVNDYITTREIPITMVKYDYVGSEWKTYEITDQLDIVSRVGRSGMPTMYDSDGKLHLFFTSNANRYLHQLPDAMGNYEDNIIKSRSTANSWNLVRDGINSVDSASYICLDEEGQVSFTSTTEIDDYTIMSVGVEFYGRLHSSDMEVYYLGDYTLGTHTTWSRQHAGCTAIPHTPVEDEWTTRVNDDWGDILQKAYSDGDTSYISATDCGNLGMTIKRPQTMLIDGNLDMKGRSFPEYDTVVGFMEYKSIKADQTMYLSSYYDGTRIDVNILNRQIWLVDIDHYKNQYYIAEKTLHQPGGGSWTSTSFNSAEFGWCKLHSDEMRVSQYYVKVHFKQEIQPFLRINGIDYYGSTYPINEFYTKNMHEWKRNPSTDNLWTPASAQAVEFGIRNTEDSAKSHIIKVMKNVYSTRASHQEYFSSEMYELISGDNGTSWSIKEITRNSGVGVPIISAKQQLTNNQIEVIWTSGNDVFYYNGGNIYDKIQPGAEDLRLFYGATEIDRVLNYTNLDSSLVHFQIQETIPENKVAGPKDYILYYGNKNATHTPLSNPHHVYHWFESWETMDSNQPVSTSAGWNIEDASAYCYQSPNEHANRLYAGRNSVFFTGPLNTQRQLGENLWNYELEFGYWNQGGNGQGLVFLDSAGGEFGVGIDAGEKRTVCKYAVDPEGSIWHTCDPDTGATHSEMMQLTMRVDRDGCHAWSYGEKVASAISAITDIHHLKLELEGSHYLDFFRGKHTIRDIDITLEDEETRGFFIRAALLGSQSFQFIIDAFVNGYYLRRQGKIPFDYGLSSTITKRAVIEYLLYEDIIKQLVVEYIGAINMDKKVLVDITGWSYVTQKVLPEWKYGISDDEKFNVEYLDGIEYDKQLPVEYLSGVGLGDIINQVLIDITGWSYVIQQIIPEWLYGISDNKEINVDYLGGKTLIDKINTGYLGGKSVAKQTLVDITGWSYAYQQVLPEWLYGVAANKKVNVDYLGGHTVSDMVNIGYLGGQSTSEKLLVDITGWSYAYQHILPEWLYGIRTTKKVNIDYLSAQELFNIINIEYLSEKEISKKVLVDITGWAYVTNQVLTEWKSGTSLERKISIEYSSLLSDDNNIPVEYISSGEFTEQVLIDLQNLLSVDRKVNIEWLNTYDITKRINIDYIGNWGVQHKVRVGYRGGVSEQGKHLIDYLGQLEDSKKVNIEHSLSENILRNSVVEYLGSYDLTKTNPVEYLGAEVIEKIVPLEYRGAYTTIQRVILEHRLLVESITKNIPISYLYGVEANSNIPVSYSGLIPLLGYGEIPIDFIGAVNIEKKNIIDYVGSGEFNNLFPVEFGGKLYIDKKTIVEWISDSVIVQQALVDYLSSTTTTKQMVFDYGLGSDVGYDLPVEYLGQLLTGKKIPIAWRGLFSLDKALQFPIEYLASFDVDKKTILEYLLESDVDYDIPVDFLGQISLSEQIPFDWTGGVAVSKLSEIPIEWKVGIESDGKLNIEYLATNTFVEKMPIEYISVLSDMIAKTSIEWLYGLETEKKAPLSYQQRVEAISKKQFPISWVEGVEIDGKIPAEWKETTIFNHIGQIPIDYIGITIIVGGGDIIKHYKNSFIESYVPGGNIDTEVNLPFVERVKKGREIIKRDTKGYID